VPEIIVICIFCVAVLLGWPLWFVFIAGMQEEHINPDIFEAESSRAWDPETEEKYSCNVDARSKSPDHH
jgi:hypothetical protein